MNNLYSRVLTSKVKYLFVCFMASISLQAFAGVTGFTYSSAIYNFALNHVVLMMPPSATGTATGWSTSGTLPAGLSLNTSNGAITGTPTALAALTSYSVSATVSGYVVTGSISFEVTNPGPKDFSYSSPQKFTAGQAITSFGPRFVIAGVTSSYPAASATGPNYVAVDNTYVYVLGGGQIFVTAKNSLTTQAVFQSNITGTLLAANTSGTLFYYNPSTYAVYSANYPNTTATLNHNFSKSQTALACDNSGAYYTLQPGTQSYIYRYLGGTLKGTTSLNNTANYLAVNPVTQDMYTVYSGAIYKLNGSTGALARIVTAPSGMAGMAVDAFGNIYILSSADHVYIYADNASTIDNITTGSVSNSIAVDIFGNIFVGTTGNSVVGKLAGMEGATTGITYSISPTLPAGLSIDANTGIISGTPTNTSSATSYTITASSGGVTSTAQVTITVNANTWIGTASSDWNTAGNWSANAVPGSGDDIDIPVTTNQPVISDGANDAAADNVTIESGATLTINNSSTININANISNSGTVNATAGTLNLGGSSAQTINGTNNTNNLTINNSNGVTIIGGNTTVYGVYTPTAGTLTTGGYLTLGSNATGTANVAQGSGSYLSGNVTVQRYIPAKRAWRFLTAPLNNSGYIYNNWQDNGTATDSTGVDIWSPTGSPASNGLSQGANGSMEYFAPASNNWIWLTNTTATLLDTTTAAAGNKAFSLFVTGPYGSGNILPSAGAAATTLTATGTLQTGEQIFNYGNVPTGNYILVGNPYASPVNFTNVGATGAASGNINNVMWAWDAQRSGTSLGGYVTFSWDATNGVYDQDIPPAQTAQTIDIQSGQAIMVQADTTTHTNGTLENVAVTFEEADKAAASTGTNGVFGVQTQAQQVRIALNRINGTTTVPVDGILVKYGNSYKPGVSDDANKLYNYDENLALRISNNYLAIERRPLPVASDTLFLDIYALKKSTNYSFSIAPQNITLGEGIQPYLIDNFLNTVTPISFTANNSVSFSTTDAAGSCSETRFTIVFSANALATTVTNLKAAEVAKGIQVQWTSVTETGIKNYIVEKSADAINFAAGTSIKPVDNGRSQNYNWLDENPFAGDNYYRIQIINNDGSINYSNVVLVKTGILSASFKAYPNPLPHSQQLKVDVGNVPTGKYTLQLFTIDGKKVIEKAIVSDGSPSTQLINLPTVATGVYQVILVDENGKTWKQQLEIN